MQTKRVNQRYLTLTLIQETNQEAKMNFGMYVKQILIQASCMAEPRSKNVI